MHTLYVHAAAVEAGDLAGDTAATDGAEFLRVGVGKAGSVFRLARRLEVDPRPDLLISFGVCGSHSADLEVGDLCLVGRDCLADEGVQTGTGFLDLEELGLGGPTRFTMDARRTAEAAALLGGVPVVPASTVSTCSGTDALAEQRARRTGARIETMEGAAVALVCHELGVPMIQLRCVSNRTGDRDRAGWDLATACANLQAAVRRLREGAWQA